jgi:pimeloyl-ACP methyl ester carboxylesterase
MIDTGAVRLHVVTAGEGPPVILLHGFPSFWQTWRHQIAPLAAAGYRVIVPDLRGCNLSEKPRGIAHYTVDRVAGDIVGLSRALGAERATVVGHDWGAVVAWALAMTWPDLVERLMVINVTHPSITRRKLYTPQRLLKWWYMLFFQLPWLPELLLRQPQVLADGLKRIAVRKEAWTSEDVRAHVEAFRQPGAATASLNYYRAALRHGVDGMRRRVRCPSMLVWGERDPILGDDLLEGIESCVPGIRVHRLPVGHWVPFEAAEELNDLLLSFLGEGAQR